MPSPPLYHIIPGAGLQFLDYDLDLSVTVKDKPLKLNDDGVLLGEREKSFAIDRSAGSAKLIFLEWKSDGKSLVGQNDQEYNNDDTFKIITNKAFECFRNRWLPLPFLEQRGEGSKAIFGFGPTDWVRGFLSFLGGDKNPKYRLTLVFDPQVEEDSKGTVTKTQDKIYHTLSQKNVSEKIRFGLASGHETCDWFLDLPWIAKFLQDYYNQNPEKFIDAATGKAKHNDFLHLAVYATFLEGLVLSGSLGQVEVVKPGGETPIKVDLVLDIGNSRLTGVLLEKQPDCRLSDCYILPIRNLSEPAHIYAEPVSSRVEFAEPYFGPPEFKCETRHLTDSFPWPSTVRIGPEAASLAAYTREDNGPTGMSSPKRYLWDTRPGYMGSWHFNNKYKHHSQDKEGLAVEFGAFVLSINSSGLPLSFVSAVNSKEIKSSCFPREIFGKKEDFDEMPAFESKYSRSSLMMFLLSEIIAQALSAINDPKIRDTRGKFSSIPRQLDRVILTVPTAMPLMEQNIFKFWAEMAVTTVWSALGWDSPANNPQDKIANFRNKPKVLCNWDEATCTQVVWLFNEITNNFNKNAKELFNLLGMPRPIFQGGEKEDKLSSLRIASIDVGAGTTDLSITTFALHSDDKSSPMIIPHQDFREGFSVAGDDVLLKIIQTQFMDKIIASLGKWVEEENKKANDSARNILEGMKPTELRDHANNTVKTFFRSERSPDRDWNRRRWQFVNQVAKPVALKILSLYEKYNYRGKDINHPLNVDSALNEFGEVGDSLSESIKYFENHLQKHGWANFDLRKFEFQISLEEIHIVIMPVLKTVMESMAEVVKLYDCDILILSGRPSLWPAIRRLVLNRPCVPTDRLVFMHEYRVGATYPFLKGNKIKDPKTTVVTGAMICAMAERSLEGLSIVTSTFEPQPTTRYLGWLTEGRIENEAVWFKNIDVYSDKDIREKMDEPYSFTAGISIGFRQLSCSRWPASRLYKLEFGTKVIGTTPFKVKLVYTLDKYKKPEKAHDPDNEGKRTEGQLEIVSISNDARDASDNDLVIRLQTLPDEEGFWLDTGFLYNKAD